MDAAAFVDDARMWARALEEHAAIGSTLENARARLARQYGIPARVFWALRHRPPKRIAADLYFKLREAYLSQCRRLVDAAQTEIAVLKSKGRSDADLASLEAEASRLAQAIENARRMA